MPQQNNFDRDSISILHTDKYSIDDINGNAGLLQQILGYELILTKDNILAIKLGDEGKLIAINTLDAEAVKGIKVDNATNADSAATVTGKIGNTAIGEIFTVHGEKLYAQYAVNATKDGNGDVISKTYATKTDLTNRPSIFYGTDVPGATETPSANAKQGDIYIRYIV